MAKPIIIGIIIVTILIAGTWIWIRFFQEAPVAAHYDFGDAPDGEIAYIIDKITITGRFPSLAANNGARAKEIDIVWLGEKADKETESKQVINGDIQTDDGITTKFESCAESEATFAVHLSKPGTISGTAYLNLFVDYNQDGEWQGEDDCSPEWVVQNVPVDLTLQTEPIAAYTIKFTAGKRVFNPWYRAVVTLDEVMAFETGEGEFKAGEIEDYGSYFAAGSEEEDTAVCSPDPLKVLHGESGTLTIDEGPLNPRKISSVELDPGTEAKTAVRNIAKKAGSDKTFIFSSNDKQKDGPPRIEIEHARFNVKFGALGKKHLIFCTVWIVHDEKIINPPPPPPWEPPVEEKEVEKWKEPKLPTQVRTLFCGDGYADAPHEDCDPGNPEKGIPPVLCDKGECKNCKCVFCGNDRIDKPYEDCEKDLDCQAGEKCCPETCKCVPQNS